MALYFHNAVVRVYSAQIGKEIVKFLSRATVTQQSTRGTWW